MGNESEYNWGLDEMRMNKHPTRGPLTEAVIKDELTVSFIQNVDFVLFFQRSCSQMALIKIQNVNRLTSENKHWLRSEWYHGGPVVGGNCYGSVACTLKSVGADRSLSRRDNPILPPVSQTALQMPADKGVLSARSWWIWSASTVFSDGTSKL